MAKKGGESIALGIIGFTGIVDTAFMIALIAPYAKELGASEPEAGLIAGLYGIAALPASVLAGFIVDRFGRKRSLTLGLAWDAVTVFAYSLASSLKLLATLRILHAIGGSLVYPAFLASVGDRAWGRRGYGFKVGTYLAIVALAVALGSLLASATVRLLGFEDTFRLLSAIIAIGLAASIYVTETGGGSRPVEVLRGIWRQRSTIGPGLALMFLLYVSFGAITGGLGLALYSVDVAESEEEASSLVGAYVGIASLASVALFLASGAALDRGLGVHLIVSAAASAIVSQIAVASLRDPLAIIVLAALYGLPIAAYMTASSYLVLMAPRKSRGGAVGFQQVVNILGIAVGAPLAGITVKYLGIEGLAFLTAAPIVVGVPVFLKAERENRKSVMEKGKRGQAIIDDQTS